MAAKKQSDDIVKIIAGASLVLGSILSALGTFLAIVDWPLERKIILGSILILVWLVLKYIAWSRKRNRTTRKKLPWLLDLFVAFQKQSNPGSKRILLKALIFRIFDLALAVIILTIVLAAGLNFAELWLRTVISPPTPTPTLTPTQGPTLSPTITPSLTSSVTPSATATISAASSKYFMIVLDASEGMNESFDGRSKWQAALESIDSILRGLDPEANYGLVVIGGSTPGEGFDPCAEPSKVNRPFTSQDIVRREIPLFEPLGGGSLYTAFTKAMNEFRRLPIETVRTMIYITGSSDACERNNEWAELDRLFQIAGAVDVNIYSEIIILGENGEFDTQSMRDHISSLSGNVNINVHAPQTVIELQNIYNTVINNVTIHVNSGIVAIASQVSPGPVQITQPAPIVTDTPIILPPTAIPPTEIIIVPDSPTPEPPTEIPPTPVQPTFPATIPAHVLTILPSQADVFSSSCFLRNEARVYAQFANNQATITTALGPGRTNQGLHLDFSNVQEAAWNYSGWEVWLGPNDQSGIDLSTYGKLVFYIKGEVGGEQPNVYLMMPITTDYWRYWKDVELVTPVVTSWRRVEIPLLHFASSQAPHQQVNLRNVQRIQVLFEWYPQPTTGKIFIDDLCIVQ